MAKGLLGKKLGMTQVFDPNGRLIPVTLIEAGPCYVLQVKTVERDGYNAVQLGFEPKNQRRVLRPERGLIDKINQQLKTEAESAAAAAAADVGGEGERRVRRERAEDLKVPRVIREIPVSDPTQYSVGQRVDVGLFAVGEKVDVIGTSKGRGFTGVIKRHHSKPGPNTHGSMYHRRPGSMGGSSWPSRVYPGKPLPGHMGNHRTTTLNLVVVQTDAKNNLLAVKGSVPGHINGYVIIRENIRGKKRK